MACLIELQLYQVKIWSQHRAVGKIPARVPLSPSR